MHTSSRRGILTLFTVFTVVGGSVLLPQAYAQTRVRTRPAAAAQGAAPARVQSASNAGTVTGIVTDPSGAVVASATVTLTNAVSGLTRTVTSDNSGTYTITNLPFNTYRLTITAPTLAASISSVDVQSTVPVTHDTTLQIATTSTTVDVTASSGDLIETDPVDHTDIDRDLFSKIPLQGSSSVSALVTLASPGISADSNGMFHSMGDHASNSFSVDGQPITDQQSKVFSNQIPLDSVQSLEVIPGAPPAEFGGKTSLVIVATTRSGLDNPQPHGQVNASYGSFGTSNVGFNLAYGTSKAGNFVSVSVMNTGRFLDPPEFHAIHDKGNEENFFDRVDDQLTAADLVKLNLGYTRSWFQTPNSYDTEYATQWTKNSAGVAIGPNGLPVGPADQRAQIQTVNFAPSYTRVLNSSAVLTTNYFFRRDGFNYYPSKNPFADLGAPDLQQETISQQRSLANTGLRSDITYTHGMNNVKSGVSYEQTFLDENFNLGIVAPTLNSPCTDAVGDPQPGYTDPTQCTGSLKVNGAYRTVLAPYDLTRGGGLYGFHGHTDVKEFAAYAQDAITAGPWTGNMGLRFDQYNGLAKANQVEPRMALSYNIKRTGTVLRTSYARTLESPFNENLIIASEGCNYAVIAALIPCTTAPNRPGFRNDFHAGFQQQITRYAVLSADYTWKYTHNAFDFSVLGATPITFPIGWYSSKVPGFDGRLDIPEVHHFTAQVVFSSVAARFFTPQTSGLGTVPVPPGSGHTPFRIDHDERFNQTTHAQYQIGRRGPYIGFNWRFDSGQVAGAAPCYGTLPSNDCVAQTTMIGGQPAVKMVDPTGIALTEDQEAQAGLACAGVRASLGNPLPSSCLVSQFTSSLLKLTAPNAQNDDHNPARIASRNLFDLSFGEDNLLHRKFSDKRTLSATVTIVNLANKYALYNFLSTFSGTHYVSPRSITAQLAYHF
jgi:hypothetical protein